MLTSRLLLYTHRACRYAISKELATQKKTGSEFDRYDVKKPLCRFSLAILLFLWALPGQYHVKLGPLQVVIDCSISTFYEDSGTKKMHSLKLTTSRSARHSPLQSDAVCGLAI